MLSGEPGYRILLIVILVLIAVLAIAFGTYLMKSARDERKKSQAGIAIVLCAFATMLSIVTPVAITPTIALYTLAIGYFFGRATDRKVES